MNAVERIAKNTRFLFAATFVTYILGFFSVSITGRYLGAELFGTVSLALAFVNIFGIISDLGLGTVTVREVARNKELTGKYFANMAAMRAFLAVLTFCVIVASAVLFGYSMQTISVIVVVALSIGFTTFVSLFYAIFRAFEKMKYQSIGLILNSALWLLGVVIAAVLSFGVISFASLYAFVGASVLIYCGAVFRRKFSPIRLEIDLAFWRSTIKMALPFALTSVFVTVFYWIDSILLSIMKGVEVVGWYSAAYRLMVVLLVVPQVVNLTIFPAMSRFYVEARGSLLSTRDTFFRYMVLIAVPMGIAVTFLASEIIRLIFGTGYTNSIIALQILVWSSVFVYLGSPFARFLESSNQQLTITKITVILMVENVVLNLILIPSFGLVAASAVTVATEGVSFLLFLYASKAVTKESIAHNTPTGGKIALASALMVIIIVAFSSFNHIVVTLAATCVYLALLYFTRVIKETDVTLFISLLRPRKDQD
jgi:O-antigen/teichoic acid export membrane protein